MTHKIVNFRADRISGWFYDPAADGARAVLDLLVDGVPVTTLKCNVFRNELSPADFPNRNIGFLGALPPDLWTGQSYTVALRDRRSGAILTEQEVTTRDTRLDGAPGFSGEFQLTDRGEIGGWIAHGDQTVGLRVFVDGHQTAEVAADSQKILVGADKISVATPPGYAFSIQLPAEYYDDAAHDVLVIAAPDSEEIYLVEQKLFLASQHAQFAEEQAERLRTGKRDWAHAWRKQPSVREDIDVTRVEVTPSYAAVTLEGTIRHRRAVLRLGEHVIRLTSVRTLHPEDAAASQTPMIRYAAEIPRSAEFAAELSLYGGGGEIAQTYDLRMGDESGRRPANLPAQVELDLEGTRITSQPQLEAGRFQGFSFDTVELEAPHEVILRSQTPEGSVELARAVADLPERSLRDRYGVASTGAYQLPLPSQVLETERSHLQLILSDGTDEHVLWEDPDFYASNEYLLSEALGTSSVDAVVDLLRRLGAAERHKAIRRFLTRYQEAKAQLRIKDIQRGLTPAEVESTRPMHQTTGAVWYWVQELRRNSGRVQWFTQNAIRNRMGDARDILAYAASKQRFNFDQLHGLLESARAEQFTQLAQKSFLGDYWTTATLCLARFLYCAPRDEIDYLDALTLYRMIEEAAGIEIIRSADRAYYGDLLTWRGEYDRARSVLHTEDTDPDHDYSQRLLALNAVNPHIAGESGNQETWLKEFNTVLQDHGVTGIRPAEGDLSFYRLTSALTEPAQPVEDGPLVTVIVPIYEPSAATNIAIESLLGQTWANLEILIMDDCSPTVDDHGNPTGYREQLESLAARDSRIQLIFHQTNRGSYSVRNDGLDLATGEFVTVADKDDWHHPQQIELQVRHLLDNPTHTANMTHWARVDQNLKMTLRSATGRVVYPSMPSVMFRREKILHDVGYWDTVRKSGDSEFKSRIENFYGTPVEPVNPAPLAFALMEGENLTRNDMGVGYLAPERRAYLRGYQRWHREIRDADASPYMPKNPDHRRFVAPPAYLPDRPTEPPAYDVVFASEFGFVAGNSTSLFTEISVCLEAGLKVAVIPFQNGLIPSAAKRQFNAKIDHLVLSGQIDRISLDTEAHTDLLIIRWPTAVQAVRDTVAALKTQRAVVVANHPPFEPGGRRSYDVGVVTRNVERLFGIRPTWAPQSEQIGAMIQPLLPAADLQQRSWKGIIEVKDFASVNRYRQGTPVIGRHGRDDPAKWPSSRGVFRAVYPVDGSVNVCILGGANVPKKRGFLPRYTTSWEVYAFNEIDVDQYLSEKLDFFVYFHSEDWVEAFGMAILEAMSYGVVCVLPKHFRSVFGDAAVYAEPDGVAAVVAALWDQQRYAEQQRRAVEFIERECTPAAYLQRLADLGVRTTV